MNTYVSFSQKKNKLNLSITPNYSFISKDNVIDADAKYSTGINLHYSRKKFRGFFSYGLEYNSYRSLKGGVPDNRTVVDNDGNIYEGNVKYYKTEFSFNFIAPQVLYNFEFISNEKFALGGAGGLKLKYYFDMKTEYNLSNERLKSSVPVSDIYEGNVFVDNPSVMVNFWIDYFIGETFGLRTELKYSYDLNIIDIPKYQSLGMGIGAFMRW